MENEDIPQAIIPKVIEAYRNVDVLQLSVNDMNALCDLVDTLYDDYVTACKELEHHKEATEQLVDMIGHQKTTIEALEKKKEQEDHNGDYEVADLVQEMLEGGVPSSRKEKAEVAETLIRAKLGVDLDDS